MSLQKFNYVRNKAILKACRSLPCQHCGSENGSVCAAHSNQAIHGHGRSIKASDIYVAALCNLCHFMVDSGKGLTRDERVGIWTVAHKKTIRLLTERGLWPEGVEVP